MNNPLLTIENLSIQFSSGDDLIPAVNNLSLTVRRGEILALVGESGSGKSVTALSILKLLPEQITTYSSGRIIFSEQDSSQEDVLQATSQQLQLIRGNKIAMIFQEPMSSLNPVMRCGKQIVEALQKHKSINFEAAKAETISWLKRVRLPDPVSIFQRYPHQLSGGQKQRVMIAMAMCCQPSLLICDEPTTALDVTVQRSILDLIRELRDSYRIGVIFISHDLAVVSSVADRIAVMYRGEILQENITPAMLQNSSQDLHPYAKALLECRPGLHQKHERLPVVNDILNSTVAERPVLTTTPRAGADDSPIISIQSLSVRYPVKSNFFGKVVKMFTAVDQVSFKIFKGETLGLVGESGCGKTTLGRTILGLVPASSGQIQFKGDDLTKFTKEQWKQFRSDVQLVFQDPFSALNPRLTIGEAIMEPMKMSRPERLRTAKRLLDQVQLPESAMSRYPHEFSGGQRQRIVIARALGMNPQLLVCDESVSALDVSIQAQILNLLNDLKFEYSLTMLFISHDLDVVRYMCDRIMVMQAGRIVEAGPAEEVYQFPKQAYTQDLIAALPSL